MLANLKPYLIALLLALGALIAAAVAYLGGSPGPGPSVTPSHNTSPSVTPSVTSSPLVSLRLMIGMTDGFDYVATSDGPASGTVSGVTWNALEVRDVETLIPSFKGARVGLYPDALMPATSMVSGKRYWIDVTGVSAGSATVFGQSVSVVSQVFTWPLVAYMELQFAQIARAHGLADVGTTFAQRVALAKQYAALLRAHGVEPIKQYYSVYPPTDFGGVFKELVLDNRIAPPCLFGPAPGLPPSTALLQAIESALKSGLLPRDSYVYPGDEGEGNATITQQFINLAGTIRLHSPSLQQMFTRRPDPAFGPGVIFTPVMNLFNEWSVSGAGWLYVSCMSNGNCQNQASAATVAQATKYPMMVLDAHENEPKRFVEEATALGAKALLYFNTTQRMPTAFDPGGQYNEGGNGDGTLLYPNGGVSRRLKFLRRGLNAVAMRKAGLIP